MNQALILHAWFNTPNNHWYPWLKAELEKRGYTVYLPEIPTMNSAAPDLSTQLAYIEQSVPLSDTMLVVGHSLGALLAMRLAEKHSFGKLILISGWDFDDLTAEHASFWKTKMDHAAIQNHCHDITCVTSDNDPYTTAFTVEQMSKRLNAAFLMIKGAGHFTKDYGITSIPQILDVL